MNLTLNVPASWLQKAHPQYELLKTTTAGVRRTVIEMLNQAVRLEGVSDTASEPVPATAEHPAFRVMLYVPDTLARRLSALAKSADVSTGEMAKRLLYLVAQSLPLAQDTTDLTNHPLVRLVAQMGKMGQPLSARPEQVTAFNCITDSLTLGRVGLVEASTGVGKTLAAVFSALTWVQANRFSACIAVPTLALIRQVAGEYDRVAAVLACPPLQVIMGKQEFVSAFALNNLLEAQPDLATPEIGQWITASGIRPPAHSDGYVESGWLAQSLLSAAPAFPINEVLLNELASPSDPGMVAYRAQFKPRSEDDDPPPTLIVCSHAMLAQDMRVRRRAMSRDEVFQESNDSIIEILKSLKGATGVSKGDKLTALAQAQEALAAVVRDNQAIQGLLPQYDALIVDEAHQLEAAFSNAFSDYLPLRKLWRALVTYRQLGGKVPVETIRLAKTAIDSLSVSAPADQLLTLDSPNGSSTRGMLISLKELLSPIANAKPAKNAAADKLLAHLYIKRGETLLRLGLAGRLGTAHLRLSPQRQYPQLYVGKDTVEPVLRMLWDRLRCAVALSATLYLYRIDGASGSYMANLLAIPDGRRSEYPPIIAPWIKAPLASLHVPTGAKALSLKPPTLLDKLSASEHAAAMKTWLSCVAGELKSIHASAAGGVLVLCTSYEMVNGIYAHLADLDPILVIAREGAPLQRQAKQFLLQSVDGKRPLWLALGGAWTGLDIGGHDPMHNLLGRAPISADQDNILTDLVIPRLPFGVNNSLTHMFRIRNRGSIPWDLLDAAFRFRQGLGRLVRQQGLPHNRRIWVLDGRLTEPSARSRLAMFRTTLDGMSAAKT